MQSSQDSFEPLSEINVTPFVDVLLVLLVIFMITAPMMTKTMKVNLPKEQLQKSEVTHPEKYIVVINDKGQLWTEKKLITPVDLALTARNWAVKSPNQTVFIKADKAIAYEKIINAMAILKNNGIANVGLLVLDQAK